MPWATRKRVSSPASIVWLLVGSSASGAIDRSTVAETICAGSTSHTTHMTSTCQWRRQSLIPTSRISPKPSGRRPGVVATTATIPARLVGTAGHGREDDERVAVLHRGAEAVEDAHVLVVEIDVHVAVERPVRAEQLGLRRGMLLGELVEQRADVRAGGLHLLLAAHGGAQHGRDLDRGHSRSETSGG